MPCLLGEVGAGSLTASSILLPLPSLSGCCERRNEGSQQHLSIVFPVFLLKTEVSQNIAYRALPAANSSASVISAFPFERHFCSELISERKCPVSGMNSKKD